eukprot:5885769-Prymnesium_polylepis.1
MMLFEVSGGEVKRGCACQRRRTEDDTACSLISRLGAHTTRRQRRWFGRTDQTSAAVSIACSRLPDSR